MRPLDDYGPSTLGIGNLRRIERDMPEFIPTRRASPVDRIRLTQALVDAKKRWYEAQARGDQSAMSAARAQGDVLRTQGADEATALSIVPGPSAPSAPSTLAVPSQYGGAVGAAQELARRVAGPSSAPTYPPGPSGTGIGILRRIEAEQVTPVVPTAVRPETAWTTQTGYPIGGAGGAQTTPVIPDAQPTSQRIPTGGNSSGTGTGGSSSKTNIRSEDRPPEIPITAVTQTASLTSGPTGVEAITAENAKLISAIEKAGNTEIQGLQSLYQTSLADIAKLRQDLIGRSEKDQKELDPATLATLDMLKGEMENGLRRVKEEANRRGILDSGIASGMSQNVDKAYGQQRAGILGDRLTRLKQNLEDNLKRIDEQAFQVKQKGAESVNEARSRLASSLIAANERALTRVENERRYQQERSDEQANRQFNQSVSEANLTGTYLPSTARSLANRVLELKKQAETPGISPEALTGYSREADTLRSQLSSYGIDPNLVGKGVNYEQAARNVAGMGTPTLAAQKAEADRARAALKALPTTPTKNEKYAGIMQGAVNLVDDLMTQGRYVGEASDVGTSRGPQYQRLSPDQAANEAARIVRSQVGDMGLTYAELNNLIDIIYRTAGVPKPALQAPRPLTSKQKWEDEVYRRKIEAGNHSTDAMTELLNQYAR